MISQIMEQMIAFSQGNLHDIDHLIRVWAYAKTIGEMEKLDAQTQRILEIAALTHDIACPLCRSKYGNTHGKHQEIEGAPMVRDFLKESALSEAEIEQVAFLVGHHHTLTSVRGAAWQVLIEADFIANASENGYGKDKIQHFLSEIVQTESGARLIRAVFCL